MQLIHALESHVDLKHDGVQLFRYVYNSKTPAVESPRPYFHPLMTLKGKVVSGFRPHDHRWHHGLSMTSAYLSEHNFWGGPTYVSGEGYRQIENNGRQVPIYSSEELSPAYFRQDIEWWSQQNTIMFIENRVLSFSLHEDFWRLNLWFYFNKYGDFEPHWGSPTTQGRENAGYGGLFWRGPREFIGGKILMSEGREGSEELMGQRSPWLAYIGQHDETNDFSTLVFMDNARNPRFPTQWFVRNSTPMICPHFAFGETYIQQPGVILGLNYQILIADGAWSRERIEAEIEKV